MVLQSRLIVHLSLPTDLRNLLALLMAHLLRQIPTEHPLLSQVVLMDHLHQNQAAHTGLHRQNQVFLTDLPHRSQAVHMDHHHRNLVVRTGHLLQDQVIRTDLLHLRQAALMVPLLLNQAVPMDHHLIVQFTLMDNLNPGQATLMHLQVPHLRLLRRNQAILMGHQNHQAPHTEVSSALLSRYLLSVIYSFFYLSTLLSVGILT